MNIRAAKRLTGFAVLAAAFAAVTVYFFNEVIFSSDIIAFRDLGRFFYPPREFAWKLIRQGVMPLWNPFIFCGNPLIASHQTAVFYPASFIYLFGGFEKAFNNFIYLHFVLAGLFMYLFLKGQRLTGSASIIGALSFAYSGCLLAAVNVLTFLSSAVWLPAVLWAFFHDDRRPYPYLMLSALFLVYMFLAGEPMIVYMTCLMLAAFSVRRPVRAIGIFALFLALAAFQLLPVLEFLFGTDRVAMNIETASKWAMPPSNLLNLVFPCITEAEFVLKDYWEKQNWLLAYYLGLLPVIMLPIAAFFARGRRTMAVLGILAISVILSIGKSTPVYQLLFRYFPGFSLFRYPVKYFFLTTFSLAWLCAIGFDFYGRNAKTDARLARFFKILLTAALISGLALLLIDIFYQDLVRFFHKAFFLRLDESLKKEKVTLPFVSLSFFTIRRTLIFFLIFVLILFTGTKRRRLAAGTTSFLIIAAVLADLSTSAYDVNISVDIGYFKKPSGNIEFVMKDRGLFRIVSSPATFYQLEHPSKDDYMDAVEWGKERLYGNRMMEYGIYDVLGYEAAMRTRVLDIDNFLLYIIKSPDETRLLDALNVKYIVSPKDFKAKGYRLARKSSTVNLYENLNCLPRAFLSEEGVLIKDKKAILDKFLDMKWDPRKEVLLEEETRNPGILESWNPEVGKEEAAVVKYEPNEVVIKAAVKTPKFLVLSDSYYPGWKVYIDGRAGKIYRANYIMRAVSLKPGEHTVKFIFDPFIFKLGLAISFSAIAVVLLLIIRKPDADEFF
jgi:hypothetical protein